jgi:hypothetical protein
MSREPQRIIIEVIAKKSEPDYRWIRYRTTHPAREIFITVRTEHVDAKLAQITLAIKPEIDAFGGTSR